MVTIYSWQYGAVPLWWCNRSVFLYQQLTYNSCVVQGLLRYTLYFTHLHMKKSEIVSSGERGGQLNSVTKLCTDFGLCVCSIKLSYNHHVPSCSHEIFQFLPISFPCNGQCVFCLTFKEWWPYEMHYLQK